MGIECGKVRVARQVRSVELGAEEQTVGWKVDWGGK
jgi:hypothetical protein